MKFHKMALALALALGSAPALAGGYYPTLPQAGTLPNTIPLTGNEDAAFDTNLPSGVSPQTETITVNQLLNTGNAGRFGAPKLVPITNTAGFTATTAQMDGARLVVMQLNGTLAAGATMTTPTAAQFLAAVPVSIVGNGRIIRVCNDSSGAFAWTVAGGTGVTVSGTATVAQNVCREFALAYTAVGISPAISLTNIGAGAN